MAGRLEPAGDGDTGGYQFSILVIDPQPLTRNCLVAAMEGASNLTMITAADGVNEARQLVDEGAIFDAAVLNLDQGPSDSHSLAAILMPVLMALPDIPLLLLASCTTPACLAVAFRLGVRAYLTSDTALAVTLEAIRLVCTGWMIYPAFKHDEPPRLPLLENGLSVKLTPRQEEVLQCLATGMPNKSIAFHLKMSESTVKAHIKEIMQRVGAANRTQVVALLGRSKGQDQ